VRRGVAPLGLLAVDVAFGRVAQLGLEVLGEFAEHRVRQLVEPLRHPLRPARPVGRVRIVAGLQEPCVEVAVEQLEFRTVHRFPFGIAVLQVFAL
jgi:hypothetical protein